MPLNKVKIGGNEYTFEYLNDPKHGDANVYGYITYGNRRIVLQKNMPNNTQHLNTLLHEIIHGVLEERGVTHKEELVVHLGNGLTQLLRDNPSLRREIDKLCK